MINGNVRAGGYIIIHPEFFRSALVGQLILGRQTEQLRRGTIPVQWTVVAIAIRGNDCPKDRSSSTVGARRG
ncbi:hypothetical protein DIC75_09800 [Methanoculleus sp. CWC-02]|uniref:Uncharacterized protein n=1 Tax=Methanoculleus oceani TaxID=2184756 RepID=A0ABD4TGS7_9EURY|nr:hypothetical protein [Methanoculleus sp. CWC-02]